MRGRFGSGDVLPGSMAAQELYRLPRSRKAKMNALDAKNDIGALDEETGTCSLAVLAGAPFVPTVRRRCELPAAIKARGTINAAIVPNYPPLDLRDPATNELSGLDVDLGKAIAASSASRCEWQETSFEQMVAAVDTGRVDAIMSGMTDLASRHDKVSFVDYLADPGRNSSCSGPAPRSSGHARAVRQDRSAPAAAPLFRARSPQWSEAHCKPAGKPRSSSSARRVRPMRAPN